MLTRYFEWNKGKSTKENLFALACFVYIITTFFTNLLHFRYFGAKIQLSEIMFFPMFALAPFNKVWRYHRETNVKLILIISLYLILDILSSVQSHQYLSIAESLGRVYLFIAFCLLSYCFNTYDPISLLRLIAKTLIAAAFMVGLVAVYSYLALAFHWHTRHLMYFAHYPYFGELYRLRVGAIYPSLFISVITLPLIFLVAVFPHNYKGLRIALGILLICTALTLSKSILLITLCLLAFVLFSIRKLNGPVLFVITAIFTITITFFTHLIVVKHDSAEEQKLYTTIYTSNRIFYSAFGYDLLETDYLTAKRTELNAVPNSLLLGVGTGNFNRVVHAYKNRGLFPLKFNDLDPHCTYLGTLVENGLPAMLMLLVFFGYMFRAFIRRKDLFANRLVLGLFLIYITFLIDAISTDILNFRHFWVFLAVAVVLLQKTKESDFERKIESNNANVLN